MQFTNDFYFIFRATVRARLVKCDNRLSILQYYSDCDFRLIGRVFPPYMYTLPQPHFFLEFLLCSSLPFFREFYNSSDRANSTNFTVPQAADSRNFTIPQTEPIPLKNTAYSSKNTAGVKI